MSEKSKIECERCHGFFSSKGIASHRRHCAGNRASSIYSRRLLDLLDSTLGVAGEMIMSPMYLLYTAIGVWFLYVIVAKAIGSFIMDHAAPTFVGLIVTITNAFAKVWYDATLAAKYGPKTQGEYGASDA